MTLKFFDSIQSIGSLVWDRVVDPDFPFFLYHFLFALETTDCLGKRTGWYPVYITAWDGGELVGATVAYQKTNSWGEYVFDFAWAEAYASVGQRYYPKLVTAVPFTPSTGRKLHFVPTLAADARASAAAALLDGLTKLAKEAGASSTHILFCREDELETFAQAGYFQRLGLQYHWHNQSFEDFESFLVSLRSKRRHEIRRERAQVVGRGITIESLTGAALTPELAERFYGFYLNTIDKKMSSDYLTREFFAYVFKNLGDKIVLMLARDSAGEPVAGALNYFGNETLYGRNWGCEAEYRSLHFELCYYQGIEYAIAHKLKKFEAGAQGEHKFNRGFLGVKTYSMHTVASEKLDLPIRNFVIAEAQHIEEILASMKDRSPYARG